MSEVSVSLWLLISLSLLAVLGPIVVIFC